MSSKKVLEWVQTGLFLEFLRVHREHRAIVEKCGFLHYSPVFIVVLCLACVSQLALKVCQSIDELAWEEHKAHIGNVNICWLFTHSLFDCLGYPAGIGTLNIDLDQFDKSFSTKLRHDVLKFRVH